MHYFEIIIKANTELAEILTAELAEIGYNYFSDEDNQLKAYTETAEIDFQELNEIVEKYQFMGAELVSTQKIEKVNWNLEWEKSFDPVIVDNKCIIRATFHEAQPQYEYEIVIDPKMSFGTGHHATTALMIEHQMQINHQGKKVMDVGSGTAVLAIMAEKLDATEILAFDIEDWAVENAIENAEKNNCKHITVKQGTIKEVNPRGNYDIVLANINRNVLLNEIPTYQKQLNPEGYLVVSGFYLTDADDIKAMANSVNLEVISLKSNNNWTSIIFKNKK